MTGIRKTKYNISEYILLNLYFLTINGRLAHIQREFHIIKNLRAYTLIGIDIIMPEYIYLNFNRFITMVIAYKNIKFNILIITLNFIAKIIFLKIKIKILIKSNKLILIISSKYKPLNLPHNKILYFNLRFRGI